MMKAVVTEPGREHVAMAREELARSISIERVDGPIDRWGRPDGREEAMAALARELRQLQDATYAVDDAAGEVLCLTAEELRCADRLREGPLDREELARRTGLSPDATATAIERLELAGSARRVAGSPDEQAVELTEHARQWMNDLWSPIHEEGNRYVCQLATPEIALIARFLAFARGLQERRAARIRALLEGRRRARRPNRLRGGLSPAALRRIQLFVDAQLDRPIRLAELAERARLSPFHFARAFKRSTGETPRTFVERRRVARAQALLAGSDRALAQVALSAGFSTQSHFTTAFRRATGFTPAQYRRGRRMD